MDVFVRGCGLLEEEADMRKDKGEGVVREKG